MGGGYIRMPMPRFMEWLAYAESKGWDKLVLLDETKPTSAAGLRL
jgi:hypothetical protein